MTRWTAVLIGAALFVSGCGSEPATSSLPSDNQPTGDATPGQGGESNPPAQSGASDTSGEAPARSGRSIARTDADGNRWVGEIPYDVWFDDPVATAGGSAAIDIRSSSSGAESPPQVAVDEVPTTVPLPVEPPAEPVTETKSPLSEVPAGSSGSIGAAESAVIADEAKRIRGRLKEVFQSFGRFNQQFKDARSAGATLSGLAGRVVDRESEVSWRERAAEIQQVAGEIAAISARPDRETYARGRRLQEQLIDLLDGNLPADLKPPDVPIELAAAAPRDGLMNRLNFSVDWLSQEIADGDELAQKKSDVTHETGVVELIARLIEDSGYDYADEQEYQSYVAAMAEAAREVRAAEQMQQFAAALTKLQKSCQDCHSDYR